MATSRAEGKRSFKCKLAVEEEEEEEEDVGDLRFGEDEKKKQREMMSSSSKRPYGSGGSTPVVVCQVENCDADFADAKPYHRRHKVCELHAKAPAVHLHGLQKRFCQQCSRFHLLSEFDENKRSCRERLAGHNERRRKISSDVHEKAHIEKDD